ncbi:MAG TPA: preprotein translocase subunit SecE [Burkholderiales bacterium]|nr:preprotein translocase subunit SecE [Burkholderiales bacterium]
MRSVDKAKIALAVLLVIAGLVGFYHFSEQALVLRILCVLGGLLAGGAVAWFTEPGQNFVMFSRQAIDETKKVVWPTRKEAVMTTGAVFLFVLTMAVFLWVTDKSLEYALYDLILGWKKS